MGACEHKWRWVNGNGKFECTICSKIVASDFVNYGISRLRSRLAAVTKERDEGTRKLAIAVEALESIGHYDSFAGTASDKARRAICVIRAQEEKPGPLPGCLGPYIMDAPDGPVCSCGRPSRHQSGWCGTTAPICAQECNGRCYEGDKESNDAPYWHPDCPMHGEKRT
jgi:hypothetical protein